MNSIERGSGSCGCFDALRSVRNLVPSKQNKNIFSEVTMLSEGLEPSCRRHWFLKPACLPIPPGKRFHFSMNEPCADRPSDEPLPLSLTRVLTIPYGNFYQLWCESFQAEARRKGRDSNPRSACTEVGFQNRCIQPLCHLSNN
jgi:hypothetical protein